MTGAVAEAAALDPAESTVGACATDAGPLCSRSAGFAEQLGLVYAENKPRLHAFLVRRLGNTGDAEDVTQDAFLRLWRNYAGEAIHAPLAMLYRIAVNIVRDGIRSDRFRRNQVEGMVDPICSASPEPDPESAASARQRLQLLRQAIDELPPRCREVFLLHKIGGRSHSEVAVKLGISRNMVEKHIIRAYSQLRTALDEGGADR